MKRRKRWLLLLLSILCFGGLGYLIYAFPPSVNVTQTPVEISILIPAFLLLFFGITSLVTFLFKNLRRGVLVATFPVVYLLLKLNHVDSPVLNLVLLGILISIELFFVTRK